MHLRKMDFKLLLLVVMSSGVQYTLCMSTTTLAASSSSPEQITTSSPQASDSSSSNMSTTVLPDSSVASDITSTSLPNITEQSTETTGTPSNQSLVIQTESPMDASTTVLVSESFSVYSSNQSLPTQTESPTESRNTTDSPTTSISESSSENPNTSGTASSRQTSVTTSPIVNSNNVVEEVTSPPNNSDTTSVEFPNGTIMNANNSLEDVSNSTNISETTATFQNVNVLDSAFFVCGVHVFQNVSINAGFLFPPSDNNMPNISSFTDAEQMFNSSYESFCGELVPFTHCVKETLKNDASETDNILKLYIDMDNLDTALDVYCNNNDSIPSQLQCTVSAVESHSCPYGGIMGISKYVMNAIQTGMPKEQYCAGLKESIRCRVDKQLKNCDTSYAETMDIVYTALTGKYCKL